MRILYKLNDGLARILIFIIKIYQKTLSPDESWLKPWLKGTVCRHKPHCSSYGIQVLDRYGFIPGIVYLMERVSKCHPFSDSPSYDPGSYKVVFFSSARIGKTFLNELVEDKRFDVEGVVTGPDKPRGRGQKLQYNPIKKQALKLGIDNIKTPSTLKPNSKEGKQILARLDDIQPDYLVVIAYGKIVPKSILKIPSKAPINIHGSLLPKYRGASPIQSVLLNNEEYTGISIMKMSEKLDKGDVIKKQKMKIKFDRTSKDIISKFKENGPKFTNDVLFEYGKGELTAKPQNDSLSSYCGKFSKKDGQIDPFEDDLYTIYNKYRAFNIWPKVWFIMDEKFEDYNGKRVIIEKLDVQKQPMENLKDQYLLDSNFNLNENIKKLKLKPSGKQAMSYDDFKQGYLNS